MSEVMACDLERISYRLDKLKFTVLCLCTSIWLAVAGSCAHLHRKLVELEGGVAALRQEEEAQ